MLDFWPPQPAFDYSMALELSIVHMQLQALPVFVLRLALSLKAQDSRHYLNCP